LLRTVTSFDSTYEGLKPGRGSMRIPLIIGFDSTYEGLKLLLCAEISTEPTRFDSTYEGLKRGREICTSRVEAVSTVPMRA